MTMRALLLATLFPLAATAAPSGRTADGCTYRVINGQYLTDCKAKDTVAQADAAPARDTTVTSYDSVPVRSNPDANAPSVQVVEPATMNVRIAPPAQNALIKEEVEIEKAEKHHDHDPIFNTAYVGVGIGSTSLGNAASSTGFGLSLGTPLSDYFNIELGYSYTSQGMSLGLASRGTPASGPSLLQEDSSLRSNLITAEMQGYLTDVYTRFRPYLGLGFGWKMSSLRESTSIATASGYSASSGSILSQTTLGGVVSAGTKLGLSRDFGLTFSFRYYFPFATQLPTLQAGSTNPYMAPTPPRLTLEDAALTGSGQTQLQGGVQYSF